MITENTQILYIPGDTIIVDETLVPYIGLVFRENSPNERQHVLI